MLDIAFKDFKAKKSRATMCIIGMMTCVVLIGVVNIIIYEMNSGLQGDVNSLSGKLYLEKQGKGMGYPPLNSVINQSSIDQVLDNNVVDPTKSTAVLMAPLDGSTTASGIPFMIVGLTPGKEQAYINGVVKVNGQDSLVGQSDNSVILGNYAAQQYNATLGSTITVDNHQMKVIGILGKQDTGWATILDDSMITSLTYAQNYTGRPGSVSTVIVTPTAGTSVQEAQNNLENSYSDYGFYSQTNAQKAFNDNYKGMIIFMNMITAMIFIVSTILIMNVMMMSVKEKTKDIGTMRALGTSKKRVMSLILYESLILSVIGGIIGILLISPAYNILGWVMGSTSFNFSLPLTVVLQISVIILVIGTLSGLLPAYLANRISPIEALRYE